MILPHLWDILACFLQTSIWWTFRGLSAVPINEPFYLHLWSHSRPSPRTKLWISTSCYGSADVILIPPKPILPRGVRETPLKHCSHLSSLFSKYSHGLPSHREHNPRATPGATDCVRCLVVSSNPHTPHPGWSLVCLSNLSPGLYTSWPIGL